MSHKLPKNGFINLNAITVDTIEANEHGLFYLANHEFYIALIDVINLLRIEALSRECHPIHEKLVDLKEFIKEGFCQDYSPSLIPIELVPNTNV